MMDKMYDLSLPSLPERQGLYLTTPEPDGVSLSPDGVKMKKGATIDLGTYFNLLSLGKWVAYTGIGRVQVRLNLTGAFSVTAYDMDSTGTRVLSAKDCTGDYRAEWDIKSLLQMRAELIGLRLFAKEDGMFHGGAYYGEFPQSRDISIGIVICTFRREKYVLGNIAKLQDFMGKHPEFRTMVVDNGSTLQEQREEHLTILHNPNFGGAGGFTRGLMEQVNAGCDYILLMDDDIDLETASLSRLSALCRHLVPERRMQMIGGAMLCMNDPTIQFENTAHWNGIRLRAFGRGLDLTQKAALYENEHCPVRENRYAAWWFCCIPATVVRRNGYPLPMFIKGDDMEYGIRNREDIMTMDGIGVWHETFQQKDSLTTTYFNNRNMMILQHYVPGGNRWLFFVMAMGRLLNTLRRQGTKGAIAYEASARDYLRGFRELTKIGADEKLRLVQQIDYQGSCLCAFLSSLRLCLKGFLDYSALHKDYLAFQKEHLGDQRFWREYLGID